MVSEARRSGLKSAGRRRFFGSNKINTEHSSAIIGDDSHRSTSKVLKSLFYHNNPQRMSDDVLSYVPSDPHVSLTSQHSCARMNEAARTERVNRAYERGNNTCSQETPVRTSLDINRGENIGRTMRGCSDADLLGWLLLLLLI